MRKILVTGASGMLGAALIPELAGSYYVAGLDLYKGQSAEAPGYEFTQCDITEKDRVKDAIEKARPDLVIHAAAWTDVDGCEGNPEKTEKINVEGTRNIARSAVDPGIPVLYMSTDFVFDGKKQVPYKESDIPNPINVYAKSKLEGEKIVSTLDKYIILRTSWLFGSGGENFVQAIIEKAKCEKKIKVVNDQTGSPTYTRDLAKAIAVLLEVLRGKKYAVKETFHVSSKGTVSWFDYAREVLKIARITNAEIIPVKSDELARPARRPAFSALDNGKFGSLTGFRMRHWKEGLKSYINERK